MDTKIFERLPWEDRHDHQRRLKAYQTMIEVEEGIKPEHTIRTIEDAKAWRDISWRVSNWYQFWRYVEGVDKFWRLDSQERRRRDSDYTRAKPRISFD